MTGSDRDGLDRAGVAAARSCACSWPLAWVPGRVAVSSSLGVCEGGRLELRLFFGVCFSMNTAISSSNSISRAWNRAWLSAVI